jgi:RNA polymerase sigma-70 factor, ECF subfamily
MSGEITALLNRMAGESGEARKQTYDQLVMILYQDLRRRARLQVGHQLADSLQPTALVHEAYERLLNYQMSFHNREHFLNVAATAMRRLLIERARKTKASKRGGGQAGDLAEAASAVSALDKNPDLLIDIDRALQMLRPEQVQLTELRFFAGFTVEETAAIMGLKPETVKKRWEVVRTLLFHSLETRRGV